jgi:hypothetical protein
MFEKTTQFLSRHYSLPAIVITEHEEGIQTAYRRDRDIKR